MIKSNEVRIGNVIMWEGDPTKLSALHIYTMFDAQDEAEEGSAIAITPEIWKKLSDEEGILDLDTDDLGVVIRTDLSGNINLVYDWSCKIVEIKYVHQLQNLYFALTGAELPIEL